MREEYNGALVDLFLGKAHLTPESEQWLVENRATLGITSESPLQPSERRSLRRFSKEYRDDGTISFLEKCLEIYESQFARHLDSLRNCIDNRPEKESYPLNGETETGLTFHHLATGDPGPVYEITLPSGKQFAAMLFMPRSHGTSTSEQIYVAERIYPMAITRDIPCLNKLVAYSMDARTIIMELEDHRSRVDLIKERGEFELTDDHILFIIGLAKMLAQRGVGLDLNGCNIFYYQDEDRFKFIDYYADLGSIDYTQLTEELAIIYAELQNYQSDSAVLGRFLNLIQSEPIEPSIRAEDMKEAIRDMYWLQFEI